MTLRSIAEMKIVPEPPDFSMVLGGPLFQLYRRTHLCGAALELLPRRILVISLLAWLPLMLLSMLEGRALGGPVRIPFLYDVEAHVRFLIALPMLIGAEAFVHPRITPLARYFAERQIVVTKDVPKLNAAINSALRARNSVAVEVALLALAYSLGLWIWRSRIALGASTWYAQPHAAYLDLTSAGYWYAFVSIPIFQFFLLRWYMRLGLWFWLLWRISRLNLHLTVAHPDLAGGIGFLGSTSYAFAPILFAQGTVFAGFIANRVLYEGRSLLSFKLEAAGSAAFLVLLILGPLVMFTPQLERARRSGSAEYSSLANRYIFGFEEKWIRGGAPKTAELLGSSDIESQADLANIFSMAREMRIVPFGLKDIGRLAAVAVAPLLPLTLTMVSVEELLTRLLKTLL